IICDDFTISRWTSVGFHGLSSQNEHGPKSTAKVKERSRPKSMQPSSLRKEILNAAHITNSSTRPAPLKLTRRISRQKMSIGRMAFSFTAGKNSDHLANRVG